jgi:hypothetical protein
MHHHGTAAVRWLSSHRRQLIIVVALISAVSVLLIAALPLLIVALVEWKLEPRRIRRPRLIGLQLLNQLLSTSRWPWCELHGLPHGPWHPCAQCGRPIDAPSRAAYCSPACRGYARLERDALDNDPRIVEQARRRLRNLHLRDLADNDPDLHEVLF